MRDIVLFVIQSHGLEAFLFVCKLLCRRVQAGALPLLLRRAVLVLRHTAEIAITWRFLQLVLELCRWLLWLFGNLLRVERRWRGRPRAGDDGRITELYLIQLW